MSFSFIVRQKLARVHVVKLNQFKFLHGIRSLSYVSEVNSTGQVAGGGSTTEMLVYSDMLVTLTSLY